MLQGRWWCRSSADRLFAQRQLIIAQKQLINTLAKIGMGEGAARGRGVDQLLDASLEPLRVQGVQGYLAHKKHPPP